MPKYKIKDGNKDREVDIPDGYKMVSSQWINEQKKEHELMGRIAELNWLIGQMFDRDSFAIGKLQLRIQDLLKRRE